MKQVLILVLLSGLIFGTALCVQAAPLEVWVESIPDGQFSINDGPNTDFSMTYLGMEYSWKKWRLGLELGTGELDWDSDLDLWEVKARYELIGNSKFGLDLYVSKLAVDGDWIEVDAVLAGLDFNWKITKRSSIIASVGYSGDAEFNGIDDIDLIAYKIKYNYQVNDKVGLGIGYRGYELNIGNLDVDTGGIFAAVTFKF